VERHGIGRADRWYLRQAASIWLFATRDQLLGRGWSEEPGVVGTAANPGGGDGHVARSARQAGFALRSLARSPGYFVPTLVMLALGLAAATTIYSVVDGIVLRPLDLPESKKLVIVCEDHARLQGLCIASPGNAEDLRRRSATLSDLGIGRGWPFSLTDGAGTRGVRGGGGGGVASAGFLRALRIDPAVGRIFRDQEVGPDTNRVVLLSHAFWVARYGARPDAVGSIVRRSPRSRR